MQSQSVCATTTTRHTNTSSYILPLSTPPPPPHPRINVLTNKQILFTTWFGPRCKGGLLGAAVHDGWVVCVEVLLQQQNQQDGCVLCSTGDSAGWRTTCASGAGHAISTGTSPFLGPSSPGQFREQQYPGPARVHISGNFLILASPSRGVFTGTLHAVLNLLRLECSTDESEYQEGPDYRYSTYPLILRTNLYKQTANGTCISCFLRGTLLHVNLLHNASASQIPRHDH